MLTACCASASWQLVLVGGGVAMGRTLTGHTGPLVTGLGPGALIIGFALLLCARLIHQRRQRIARVRNSAKVTVPKTLSGVRFQPSR